MKKLRLAFSSTMLLMYLCSIRSWAVEGLAVHPEDSLVVVMSSSFMGKFVGNGFVVGNGTLVVTAHHVVFEQSIQGRHEMAGLVYVLSPFLGEATEAEIIGADRQLDLAVLKVAWLGHPALKLAGDDSITSADDMEIVGMPTLFAGLASDSNGPFSEVFSVERETLPVDFVAVRRQTPRFISLSGVGKLGDGWSGSPMLLPGTSDAAGCFVRLHRTVGRESKCAEGPAIAQVKRLVAEAGNTEPIQPPGAVLPRAEDGIDVFLLKLQAYGHRTRHDYDSAFEKTQQVFRMRPESVFARILAASIAEDQGKFDEAESYYQNAVESDPAGKVPKLFYAQFLSQRQPEKALELLDEMWKFERLRPHVAIVMGNVLSEYGEFQRCSELVKEALKVNPKCAYLWVNLGASNLQLGKSDEAVAATSRAVELLPERGAFRGQLARMLEEQGRLDEAEKHFRELLKIEPDNPVVHVWLAQFLAKHRHAAKEEALKEAQIALRLLAKGGIPRQVIEQLINDLQAGDDQEQPK